MELFTLVGIMFPSRQNREYQFHFSFYSSRAESLKETGIHLFFSLSRSYEGKKHFLKEIKRQMSLTL